jgi:chorismate synthase
MEPEKVRAAVEAYKRMRRENDPIYRTVYTEGRITHEMRLLEKMAVLAEIEKRVPELSEQMEFDAEAVREKYGVHPTMNCPDLETADAMARRIVEIRDSGDSSGGLVEVVATGVPAGMGEPVFAKLDGELGRMLSIGAIKAVEVGAGYASKDMTGSEFNDQMRASGGEVEFLSNNAGGVTGGLTTGQPVVARIAVKPTPTIAKPQKTIDKVTVENAELAAVTRRDPTIVARVWPVAEAFMAIVLADQLGMHLGYRALSGMDL